MEKGSQISTSLTDQARKHLDEALTLTNTSVISRYEREPPKEDGMQPSKPRNLYTDGGSFRQAYPAFT